MWNWTRRVIKSSRGDVYDHWGTRAIWRARGSPQTDRPGGSDGADTSLRAGSGSGGRAGWLVTERLLVRWSVEVTLSKAPNPKLLPTSWLSPCMVDPTVGV